MTNAQKWLRTFWLRARIMSPIKIASNRAPSPTIMRGKLDTTLTIVSSLMTLAADASSITTLYALKDKAGEDIMHADAAWAGIFCLLSGVSHHGGPRPPGHFVLSRAERTENCASSANENPVAAFKTKLAKGMASENRNITMFSSFQKKETKQKTTPNCERIDLSHICKRLFELTHDRTQRRR